jgi:hypothetical protein
MSHVICRHCLANYNGHDVTTQLKHSGDILFLCCALQAKLSRSSTRRLMAILMLLPRQPSMA